MLQNGVDHVERVGPFARPAAVLPVVNWCRVEPAGEGRVRRYDALRLSVPGGPAGEAFAALLDGAAQVAVGGDFAREAWRKLCANAVAGLMALAGRPTEIFAHDDVRAVASALARESAAVARAEGVALGDGDADDVVHAGPAAARTRGTRWSARACRRDRPPAVPAHRVDHCARRRAASRGRCVTWLAPALPGGDHVASAARRHVCFGPSRHGCAGVAV